jgi:hypothetical protein
MSQGLRIPAPVSAACLCCPFLARSSGSVTQTWRQDLVDACRVPGKGDVDCRAKIPLEIVALQHWAEAGRVLIVSFLALWIWGINYVTVGR